MSEEPGTRSAAAAAAEKVRAILEEAERETATQLHRVGESADRLAQRADEIERRLEALADGVRDALRELREELRELRDTPSAEPAEKAAATEPVARGAALAHPEPVDEAEPVAEAEAVAAPEPEAAAEPDPPPEPTAPASPGSEGARVIALNMALGGSSREETAAYLAENFELDDPDGLLDEVYARAKG